VARSRRFELASDRVGRLWRRPVIARRDSIGSSWGRAPRAKRAHLRRGRSRACPLAFDRSRSPA